MNQQQHIMKELEELSPTLAAIPRRNVFSVPEGYFDSLSSQLLLDAGFAENQDVRPIPNASIPTGYFETLADNILSRIKNDFMGEVARETHGISSLVAGIGTKNVYTIPGDYFTNLSDRILNLSRETSIGEVAMETKAISPLVAGIGNKNVYNIPEGYFAGLPGSIGKRVEKPARVVQMKSRFTAFRYAAAAALTGLVGLSILFLLNKENGQASSSTQTSAVLSEANKIIRTNSFDKEFSSVSDAAIVSFLESKGQDVEAALVASLTDDKNLPDADDYLINENTLDEVLKTIDLNN